MLFSVINYIIAINQLTMYTIIEFTLNVNYKIAFKLKKEKVDVYEFISKSKGAC